MGIDSINANMYGNPYYQLMNMENMLGYSFNCNAPSMSNNYCMNLNPYNSNLFAQYCTPGLYGSNTYFGYNPNFCGGGYYSDWMNNNTGFGMSAAQNIQNQSQQNVSTEGLSKEEIQALNDYYQSHNVVEEGFKGALTGGLSFWAFENMQSLLHPINAIKGFKGIDGINGVKEIFKDVKVEGSKLNQLWKADSYLAQDAYDVAHKLIRDCGSKGFYSKWLRKPLLNYDKAGKIIKDGNYNKVKDLLSRLEVAFKNGNTGEVRAITEEIKAARGMNGRIPTAIDKIKTFFGGKSRNYTNIADRLAANGEKITKGIEESKAMSAAINEGKFLTGLGKMVKLGFKKDFFGWMLFEGVFGLGKIAKGFRKDSSTGLAQTGQTLGKAAGNAAGWCLGKAAGGIAGAKLGAVIGSACPGLGTAIGAIVGFIGGSIGMWAMGKLTNKVFGKDVVDKIEEKEMAKTQEGQAQLISFAYEKAQAGEKLDAKTQQALNHAISLYA